MEILLIVGIIVVVLFAAGILIYNGLVQKRLRIDEAFAQIEVQLKRRYDLIPNLIETAKGYMKHERETLDSVIKARNAARHTGLPAIADDSGIEVDALNGAPGIYSARYAGAGASDRANLEKLLHELQDVAASERSARFQCLIVYLRHADDPTPLICQGTWEGRILEAPRGAAPRSRPPSRARRRGPGPSAGARTVGSRPASPPKRGSSPVAPAGAAPRSASACRGSTESPRGGG